MSVSLFHVILGILYFSHKELAFEELLKIVKNHFPGAYSSRVNYLLHDPLLSEVLSYRFHGGTTWWKIQESWIQNA